jgi:hypothetical protein
MSSIKTHSLNFADIFNQQENKNQMNKTRKLKIKEIIAGLEQLAEKIEDIEFAEEEDRDERIDKGKDDALTEQMQEFVDLMFESRECIETAKESLKEVTTTEKAIV